MKIPLIKTNKKAQSVFGMPFSVIFSIFLIAIFLAVAIYAIMHFLDIRKCTEIGLFIDDFEAEINRVWSSQSSDLVFTRTLPSKINYLCFADLNEAARGNIRDAEGNNIYDELKKNAVYTNNMFFYPRRESCIPSKNVQHLNISGLSNPYCIETASGKINIKIEKGFYEALVKISRAD